MPAADVTEELDLMADAAETGADAGNDNDDGQPAGSDADGKGTSADDRYAAIEAKFEALQQQNAELLDRLSRQAAPAPVVEDDDDAADAEAVEDTDPAKLADELTTIGTAALKKRGFMTAKEVKALVRAEAEKIAGKVVDRKAERMSAESTALAPYAAELNDPKSPLRAKVAEVFNDMVKADPRLKDSPAALATACRAAKAELAAEAGAETTRQQRVARQAGDSGARGGGDRGGFNGDPNKITLTDQDRQVIRAMGITEKEFIASKAQLKGGR